MTRRLKHLPLNEWPDDDREAFALLFEREGDLFDDNGPLSHVSPATERAFIHSYRRWLGFLTAHHQQLLSEPPGDRVTPATVEAYGRHLQKTCNPHSTADQITKLHLCIRKLAPQRDWGWIARLCARLRISAGRRPSRPHIFVTSAQTFDFGIRLMEEAWQVFHVSGERSKNTLMNYRDGLVIAMLSTCPVRRRNITSIEIGHNLIKQSQGYILQFDREETKTSNSLTFGIHKDLTKHLDRYLENLRPCFPQANQNPFLFASFKGVGLGGDRMNKNVKHLMKQEFGTGFTLHDFRRIAATTRATHDPGNINLASQLLGHADTNTTDEHYILASSLRASQTMNRIISETRKKTVSFE
jgi:integrase/recombinase XerD